LRDQRLAIIGAGNMGEALLRGLLHAGAIAPERVVATGRRESRLATLHATYGVTVTTNNREAVKDATIVMLGIKPQIFGRVLPEIANDIPAEALVVSIAAGMTIASICKALGSERRVIRAMPN